MEEPALGVDDQQGGSPLRWAGLVQEQAEHLAVHRGSVLDEIAFE